MDEAGPSTDEQKEKEEFVSPADQWRRYMSLKKSKLLDQIGNQDPAKRVSSIFNGVSIYVNGYTDPPASELRRLIQMHGGEYHIYYEYGTTTYTVATHIAKGKVSKLRTNEKIIHPSWITHSIEAGKRVPEDKYLIYKNAERGTGVSRFVQRQGSTELNAANDPNFISNFYGRSRLHLISTLAQEMKQYVSELRTNPPSQFISRPRLNHLICERFDSCAEETICHVDLDCFFVSVALRTRPELIGKPVAITHSRGSDAGGMSEVASCSYEARDRGVRNGCYVRQARALCPDLICLPYQFDDYRATSKLIYDIIFRYTVDVRAVSCDEMYVDLRSVLMEMHIKDVMGVVTVIREEIRTETGCNASVGLGPNMLIARLSTRHAKPNGQFMVESAQVEAFMKQERISHLPGIGHNIRTKLTQWLGEMELCSELQAVEKSKLQQVFGDKMGVQIHNLCRGIDNQREFINNQARKSISCDINYGIRFTKESELLDFISTMAAELEKKLCNAHMKVSTITVKLMVRAEGAAVEPEKYMGHGVCDTVTRSSHLLQPASTKTVIFQEARKLISSINPLITDLRGIGIQLTRLSEAQSQTSLSKGTLVDFFAVRTKAGHSDNKRKLLSDEEDVLFQRALKESLRDENDRRARLLKYGDRRSARPTYHHLVDDEEVKAEMCRVLERCPEPSKEETEALTVYLYRLGDYGNWSEVRSQLSFLERRAAQMSERWMLAVVAIRALLDHLCVSSQGCHSAL